MMRGLAFCLALAGCASPNPPAPPVGQTTIPNPMDYLVQYTENGNRHDWPLPRGYVLSDSIAVSDRVARQGWDFHSDSGDGYQLAEWGHDGYVRFTETVDGGTPWTQHFVGQRCGGSGWIVFAQDAPTGTWRETIARLSIAQDPSACPPLGEALTRYRLELVDFPFAVKGATSTRMVLTVISEHYDRATIETSGALERSYLGQGYGLLRWEAWRKTPPPIGDLPERCGPVAFSDAPAPGWQINDCRTYSNFPVQP